VHPKERIGQMQRSDAEMSVLYKKYENLIGYAANCYAGISSSVDVEDLYQEGCLLFMHTWTRDDIPEAAREPMFKKSLFLKLRSQAWNQVKLSNYLFDTQESSDESTGVRIDFDAISAASDVGILNALYASEFMAEVKRICDDDVAEMLDFIVSPTFVTGHEVKKKGDWVPAAAKLLGRTVNEARYSIYKLQAAVRAVAPRFGLAV
jgi:hypothetical protein